MERAHRIIYASSFLFTLHVALTSYVNSTMLSNVINTKFIGIVYALASLCSLLALSKIPLLTRKYGAKNISYFLTLTSALLLFGIAFGSTSMFIAPLLFVLYLSLNTLVLFVFDLMLESYSSDTKTGGIRGLYLTITNLAWVCAPLLSGIVIQKYGYDALYIYGACLVFSTFLGFRFGMRTFKDAEYEAPTGNPIKTFFSSSTSIKSVLLVNFLLNFFFAVMVIYSPLYLTTVIGFDWKQISYIFMIMLTPFVIFQYPLGKIADKYLGEKELLITGLVIMGTATILFATIPSLSLLGYALILFLTRVGASAVEVMSETYFFKNIHAGNTQLLSLFRSIFPFAYIVAPLLVTLLFFFTSYTFIFIALGICMFIGIIPALRIHDTK